MSGVGIKLGSLSQKADIFQLNYCITAFVLALIYFCFSELISVADLDTSTNDVFIKMCFLRNRPVIQVFYMSYQTAKKIVIFSSKF